MIAFLTGELLAVEDGAVVVDVGGVGYRVHVPTTVLADLGPVGSEVRLHIHMHVRETEIELFGAADAETLGFFKLLLNVSGIGPKLGLGILSSGEARALKSAIVGEDVNRLVEVPGVGRKTAQRIVIELKSRLESEGFVGGGGAWTPAGAVDAADSDAMAALLSLGYSRGEARRALAGAGLDGDASVEDRIRAALQALATG